MAAYLLMRLYGPMASWGEIAVGEARHSAVQPSRSALLGLLGAALGVQRDDEESQTALANGYRFGVKLVAIGSPLRDYHTVQAGTPARKERFRTRRQSLMAAKVDTLLSTREYRCDSVAIVAVQATTQAPYSLEQLADALRKPRYALYLGRKSCPLALPVSAVCVEAESLKAALDDARFPPLAGLSERRVSPAAEVNADSRLFGRSAPRYFWEDGMTAGMTASFETVRHDQPISRRRWQFAPRREHVKVGEGDAA